MEKKNLTKTMTISFKVNGGLVKMKEDGVFSMENVIYEHDAELAKIMQDRLNLLDILTMCGGYKDQKWHCTEITDKLCDTMPSWVSIKKVVCDYAGIKGWQNVERTKVYVNGVYEPIENVYVFRFYYWVPED